MPGLRKAGGREADYEQIETLLIGKRWDEAAKIADDHKIVLVTDYKDKCHDNVFVSTQVDANGVVRIHTCG